MRSLEAFGPQRMINGAIAIGVWLAIAEIHKAIALLKAEDGSAHKAETRAGVVVAQTMQVADDKLQRAVGL